MILLILGVLLWILAHAFGRIAPERRAVLGEKGKGPIALAILGSIVLMTVGYKLADGPYWWGRSVALTGINNLLVLAGFYFFAASGMKTRVARAVVHPQLIGFSLWAFGHLIVNGDLPSLILFGGLLGWALWEISVGPNPVRSDAPPPPWTKDLMALAGGAVAFAVVALLHGWLGPWPFG